MTKEKIENEEIKEIVKQAVNNTIDEITEGALRYAQPELIKKNIFYEIKIMFLQLLSWFIYIAIGIFVINIFYAFPFSETVENASLKLIGTLDISLIIKNYIILGINFLLVFSLFSFVYSKLGSKIYEENRKNISELRNIIYVLFIGLFSLQSFTVEQLNLVLLITSLILLFEFVFKTEGNLSKEEFKEITKKIVKNNWVKEIEQEKSEKKRKEGN